MHRNVSTEFLTYEALHLSHDQRCATDVTDSADIFTVSRANIFRKKPKISAHLNTSVKNAEELFFKIL